MRFWLVQFNIEISKVTGSNFTDLAPPNAGVIAVERVTHRFLIFLTVPKIFAAKLRSRPKSGQILHVFGPWSFFGKGPLKFWTNIIKLSLVLTLLQNFTPVGPSISEISRWQKNLKKTSGLKHKSSWKLSFPGGLTKNLEQSPTCVRPAP